VPFRSNKPTKANRLSRTRRIRPCGAGECGRLETLSVAIANLIGLFARPVAYIAVTTTSGTITGHQAINFSLHR
jgi:hypothetical protein